MKQTVVNQELFAAAVKSMPSGHFPNARRNAAATFASSGFPTNRCENWKYTNLSAAAELSNNWLRHLQNASTDNSTDVPGNLDIEHVIGSVDAHWLVVRNGIVDDETLQIASAAIGDRVELTRLSDNTEILTDDAMSAFNAALLRDGLVIRAPKQSKIDKPIGLLFIDDGHE